MVRLFLFDSAFIAEFKVQNNLRNCLLEDVRIELKHSGESFEVLHITPAKAIQYTQTGDCYVGIRKSADCEDLIAEEKFAAVVRYTVKEVAGEAVKKTYQDEFSLEGFEIKLASYMAPWQFEPNEFAKQWESMKGFEENGTFQLKYASTQAAEQELIKHFGLRKIENVEGANKGNMVAVNLAGRFLGSSAVLVVLMLAFDTKLGCLLKIKIKSEEEELTGELINSLE
jgi:coatomer subunit gamma